MIANDFNGLNLRLWNRKYLNAFWYALILATLTEELYMMVSGEMTWERQLRYVFMPSGISALLLGMAEMGYRRLPKSVPYVMLLAANSIFTIMISVHYVVDFIQCLLMLPIVIAAFYYNKQLVLYASGLSNVLFLLLSLLHPGLSSRTSIGEMITMHMILLITTFIAVSVMKRGRELMNELRHESQDRQSLMIQNVIKDKMVRTDVLTGLNNRSALFDHLDMLIRYMDSVGFSIHAAMLDIDHFKSVNDTFGHHVGDEVLKRVAAVIREEVGVTDFAARYGGEEFSAVFAGRTEEEARVVLERVRTGVERLVHPELDGRCVTISIGISSYSKGMTKEQLLKAADSGLYEAKRSGRNRIVSGIVTE